MANEVCNVDGTNADKHHRVVPFGAARRVYGVHNQGGGITVASTCSELVALPHVRAGGLDIAYLDALACETDVPDVIRTAYRAVFTVPAGFAITKSGRFPVRISSLKAQRWAETGTPPQRLARALDSALRQAIGKASKVAVMGGGGVDSTALFSAVHGMQDKVQSALFSLCFEGPDSDLPYLDVLEAHTGTTAYRFTPAASADRVRSAFVMDAQPYLWPTGAWELEAAARAKAWGAELLLTGAGGDDTFAPWWPTRWWSLPRSEKERVRAYYTHARRAAAVASRGCFEVAAGLVVREPFVDVELVRTAASMRAKDLEPGGISRGLLRHIMQSAAPREICHRQSKADFTPALISGIYESQTWSYVQELGRGDAMRAQGMQGARVLAAHFPALDADPTRGELWAKLWPAIAVEHFVRQWRA